jgi:hypothetical protein
MPPEIFVADIARYIDRDLKLGLKDIVTSPN